MHIDQIGKLGKICRDHRMYLGDIEVITNSKLIKQFIQEEFENERSKGQWGTLGWGPQFMKKNDVREIMLKAAEREAIRRTKVVRGDIRTLISNNHVEYVIDDVYGKYLNFEK